jgi:hypothetical protein
MLRVYHLHPWQLGDYRLDEINAIGREVKAMNDAAKPKRGQGG